MGLKFKNNAYGTLNAGVNPADTTIALTAGHGARFPATTNADDYFFATLIKNDLSIEVIKVTARAADSLTVVRALDGTAALTMIAGEKIELRICESFLNAIRQEALKPTALAGTDTYTGTLDPVPDGYTDGQVYVLSFPNANTVTNPTVNLNALGALNLLGPNGGALAVGDIAAGMVGLVQKVAGGSNAWLLNPALPVKYAQEVNGRLTLASGSPVPSADQSGKTTVYFTPYKGNTVQLYNGSTWAAQTFSELSQATTDATKSPAAVAADKNYDCFAWNDSGTLRCTRGPAWASDTARGTGAGTTELELFQGRLVNKYDITNGPAARRGLYVGCVRSDSSSQMNDTIAKRHLKNYYNRVQRVMRVSDSTDTWTYSTAAWRQARGSTANQLDFLCDSDDELVEATASGECINSTATNRVVRTGIGLDGATSFAVGCFPFRSQTTSSEPCNMVATYRGSPGLGRHTLTWLEYGGGGDTQTWRGDAGFPDLIQSGICGVVAC